MAFMAPAAVKREEWRQSALGLSCGGFVWQEFRFGLACALQNARPASCVDSREGCTVVLTDRGESGALVWSRVLLPLPVEVGGPRLFAGSVGRESLRSGIRQNPPATTQRIFTQCRLESCAQAANCPRLILLARKLILVDQGVNDLSSAGGVGGPSSRLDDRINAIGPCRCW